MSSSLRVVVSGLAVTYPYGGVFWDYLQYVLGLRRLGHDVWYVEDAGRWCYDPRLRTYVEQGGGNAGIFAARLARLDPDLSDRWFFRDAAGATFGRPWDEVVALCCSADLFLNVSAACWMDEPYASAQRTVLVDSDPMFTQASVPGYLAGTVGEAERRRVDMLLRHDAHFTFGENVGAADCHVPAGLFNWRPTRQPVVIEAMRPAAVPVNERRRAVTTVASWEAADSGRVVNGRRYGGKGRELLRFLELARRSPVPITLALNGLFPEERFRAQGWRLEDPEAASSDPWGYRGYLADSLAEWSVAKHAYVASRSGWFSCRSACYLALGVPVVVQDTGWTRHLPAGEGLLGFSTVDDAAAALEAVAGDTPRHAAAALAIARDHFDARLVLGSLLDAIP